MRRITWILAVLALAGCQDLKHRDLGPAVTAPSGGGSGPCGANNGTWPVITNFDFDLVSNNGGGSASTPNNISTDPMDGPPCTGGGTTALLAWQSGASCYAHFTYNVVLNTPCTYQYASFFLPMVTQTNWTGKTGLSFKVRSDAPGRLFRISTRTAAVDSCLGAKNKMHYDYTTTTNAWENVSLNFASFTLANAGCPYPMSDVPGLGFAVETAGQSGTFDFDDIQLLP